MKTRNSRAHRKMIAVLKQARLAAGLTGEQVSTRIRRRRNYVSLIETGARMLEFLEFDQYARACEADPIEAYREIHK